MAEPLKNYYGPGIPKEIARMIKAVHPSFADAKFVKEALAGYEELELMQRARKITLALKNHLPPDYPGAMKILLKSLGPKNKNVEKSGMSPFIYLPHVFFVAQYGLNDFDISMKAQYELTQRFTAEFSIRTYLEKYQKETLAVLARWAKDPSPHVRRLVSEGSRPRLPWTARLRSFQKNPAPVLKLLGLLKDDPELYVRRSVANNLNDIGKDNPELLIKTVKSWLKGAPEQRKWVIRHALRSAVKRGETAALEVLGFNGSKNLKITNVSISPARVKIGDSITIAFDVKNTGTKLKRANIDFRIHFVKASGKTGAKVFKLKTAELAAGQAVRFSKKVSLKHLTTRRHYPGAHAVDALVNGQIFKLGRFDIR